MTYRMIAIDLDGTLLSPHGNVTPRTKAAVHRALSAGMLICFATGRNWTESRLVLEAIEHFDTAVFVGGAMVIDTKHEVTLHRTLMSPALAAEVCEILESSGHAALAMQDTATAGVDYLISRGVEPNASTNLWLTITRTTVKREATLSLASSHDHTLRVGIVAKPAEINEVRGVLDSRLGAQIFCHSITIPGQGVEVLEVFDPSVNKWQGLLHVARRHGILPAEIIAIGDDLNDLPMLREAGLGVAMGNGHPEAKAAAKRVIGSNKEDGLAVFLDELIDKHTVAAIA